MGQKKDFTDFSYRDVSNVMLDKGMLRSTVRCTLRFGGEPLSLSRLPNSDAERAYGLVRENIVRYQSPFTAGSAGVPPFRQTSAPLTASVICGRCGAQAAQGQRFCGCCGGPL